MNSKTRMKYHKYYKEIKDEKGLKEYLDGLLLGDGSISLPKGRLPFYNQTVALSKIEWAGKIQKDIINFGLSVLFMGRIIDPK